MDDEASLVIRGPCEICSTSIYSLERSALREQLKRSAPVVFRCPICGGERHATARERDGLKKELDRA